MDDNLYQTRAREDIPISERECEILDLVRTGATNQQIAQQLHISANTVKRHLSNINTKLDTSSRTEAVVIAIQHGWIGAADEADTLPAVGPSPEHPDEPPAALPAALPAATDPAPPPPTAAPVPEAAPPVRPGFGGRRLVWLVVAALLMGGLLVWQQSGSLAGLTGAPSAAPAPLPTSSALSAGAIPLNQNNRWHELAAMPTARASFGLAPYAFDGDTFLYVIGGETGSGVSDMVVRFDLERETWERRAAKPTAVTEVYAAAIGSLIYVPGGRLASGEVTDLVEAYDPRTNSWTTVAPLPAPRSGYALAAVEGKLYVFGGWDGSDYRAEVWEYSPDSNRWVARTSLPTARAFAVAATFQARVFVLGGENTTGPLAANEEYTPAAEGDTGSPWVVHAPLLEERSQLAAAEVGGQLFVLNGSRAGDLFGFPGMVYNASRNLWQQHMIPLQPSEGLRVAAVGDLLYIVGGRADDEIRTAVYSYQPVFTVVLPLR